MVWACYENGGGEKTEEVLDVAWPPGKKLVGRPRRRWIDHRRYRKSP